MEKNFFHKYEGQFMDIKEKSHAALTFCGTKQFSQSRFLLFFDGLW